MQRNFSSATFPRTILITFNNNITTIIALDKLTGAINKKIIIDNSLTAITNMNSAYERIAYRRNSIHATVPSVAWILTASHANAAQLLPSKIRQRTSKKTQSRCSSKETFLFPTVCSVELLPTHKIAMMLTALRNNRSSCMFLGITFENTSQNKQVNARDQKILKRHEKSK